MGWSNELTKVQVSKGRTNTEEKLFFLCRTMEESYQQTKIAHWIVDTHNASTRLSSLGRQIFLTVKSPLFIYIFYTAVVGTNIQKDE